MSSTNIASDALMSTLNAGWNTTTEDTKTDNNTLDQNTFMTLLLTQLQNQDPTKPMDSTEYLAQLAQFTNVTELQNLRSTVEDLSSSLQASQTVAASNLVGHLVMVEGKQGYLLSNYTLDGQVELGKAADAVNVKISDSSGQLVRTLNLGAQNAGTIDFSWDGKNSSGTDLAAGLYRFSVETVTDGTTGTATTVLPLPVQSVTVGDAKKATEMTLNVPGLSEGLTLGEIRRIL